MPELPDVESFKTRLDAASLHKTIHRTRFFDERILRGTSRQALSRRLKRTRLLSSHRHGKYLFVELESGGDLVLHFGMTGGLEVRRSGDAPRFTRLLLEFENGGRLAVFSKRMLAKAAWTSDRSRFLREKKLGPDALDPDFSGREFADRLSKHRGSLKAALMNQSILAGIGNVYSDEILFQAKTFPAAEIPGNDRKRLSALYRVMRRVLAVAARRGGAPGDLPRSYLLKHREAGAPCPRCRSPVASRTVSGRTACYCPRCQRPS
jgi:formamidopyrimidine-DNA glycosylase